MSWLSSDKDSTSARISINSELPVDNTAESLFGAKSEVDDRTRATDDTTVSNAAKLKNFKQLWTKTRSFIPPIEIPVFLFLLSVNFGTQACQQYVYHSVFTRVLGDNANYSDNVSESCLWDVTNLTSQETFSANQKIVKNYNIANSLLYLLPSLVMAIFIGPLSDRFGRKPFLLLAIAGQMLSPMVGLAVVYCHIDVKLLFLGSFSSGILGGIGVVLALSFSYVADITQKEWLSIRMGTLEGSLLLANTFSAILSESLVDKLNCDFRLSMWVVFSSIIAGLFFSFFLPESLNNEVRTVNFHDSKKGWPKMLVRGLQLCFWKSYIVKQLWRLWLVIAVMMIMFFNLAGVNQVLLLFLHNKPLEWNSTIINIYLGISSIAHLLVLVVILPLLIIYNFQDLIISLIGAILAFSMSIFVASLTESWEMFLAGVLIGFELLVSPGLRKTLAHTVKKDDLGAIFSVAAAFLVLAQFVATVTFIQVYPYPPINKGLWSEGSGTTKPGKVHWITSCTWAIAVAILMTLTVLDLSWLRRPKKKSKGMFVNANIFHRNKYGGISDLSKK